jgi:hypothetical protein
VLLEGVVHAEPYAQGLPLEGVSVVSRDGEHARFSSTRTDESGAFALDIAAGQDLFLELSLEGRVTTLFAGEAGLYDMDVGAGTLFVRDAEAHAALRASFGACGDPPEGGVVEGEVRVYFGGFSPENLPVADGAWVRITDAEGQEREACYLDDEGTWDAEALHVGETGRFAFFGLPPGPYMMHVAWGTRPEEGGQAGDYSWLDYYLWAAEGATTPFYPAFVEVES